MVFRASLSSKKEAWLGEILEEMSLGERHEFFDFVEWCLLEDFRGPWMSVPWGGNGEFGPVFFRTNLVEPVLEFETEWELWDHRISFSSIVIENEKLAIAIAKTRIFGFGSGETRKEVLEEFFARMVGEEGVSLEEDVFGQYELEERKTLVREFVEETVENEVVMCGYN